MYAATLKVKVAAWIIGGLLFYISGCSSAPPEDNSIHMQVQTEPTLAPLVNAETRIVPTPTPIPAAIVPSLTPPPLIESMPIHVPENGLFTYHTVTAGQTLSYIALLYQTEVEELVKMNDLEGPATLIQIGQRLRVPVQLENIAPNTILLPDSEVVYSPGYVNFNLAEFVHSQGGYLASYYETVDGQQLSGAEIIERVSEQFSVGPRLLLALLEHYGRWVTNPSPTKKQLRLPLGPRNPRVGNLYRALGFTANRINAGYYGYKRDGFWIFHLPDGNGAINAPGINAGTVGVQNILAIHSDWETWQAEMGPEGLMADYRALFGHPFAYEVKPLVPIDLTQPPLSLPWAEGQGFYLTSGPHGGYVDGSAWAAIDFGPPDVLGNCFYSNEPVTAAASGVVVVARQGEVQLDLDGDGNIQSGWVLLYLHVALDFDSPVQVGQGLKQGDIIGYASCEGGLANASHLHLARRYNGEWIEAGGPVPMNLSGWVVQPNLVPYEGTMSNGIEVREACECWDAALNLIVNTATD